MRIFYPAPPDRLVFWTTRLYWLLAILVIVTILSAAPPSARAAAAAAAVGLLAGVMIGTGLIAWGAQPRAYAVSEEVVVIQRRAFFSPLRIPLASITGARPLELTWTVLRMWGVGGLYSNTGWFWTPEIGVFWMASTNGHHLVLLEGRRRVVISPEDRAGFLQAVNEGIAGTERLDEELEA